MTRYPCRCNRCQKRRTFRKHPDVYVRASHTRCCCGGAFKPDMYRRTVEHRKTKCECDAFWYPHRGASSPWCREHPVGPSEQDWINRYGEVTN